jgi:hypothetical protein
LRYFVNGPGASGFSCPKKGGDEKLILRIPLKAARGTDMKAATVPL